MKDPWIICPICKGDGHTVNPNIDAGGLTAEDSDFVADYVDGLYNQPCAACNGKKKMRQSNLIRLEMADDARRTLAGDHRYGY